MWSQVLLDAVFLKIDWSQTFWILNIVEVLDFSTTYRYKGKLKAFTIGCDVLKDWNIRNASSYYAIWGQIIFEFAFELTQKAYKVIFCEI